MSRARRNGQFRRHSDVFQLDENCRKPCGNSRSIVFAAPQERRRLTPANWQILRQSRIKERLKDGFELWRSIGSLVLAVPASNCVAARRKSHHANARRVHTPFLRAAAHQRDAALHFGHRVPLDRIA